MNESLIKFDLPTNQSSIIKVIGVGGGGGNAVNYMYQKGICDVDFVICNTDLQVLNQSPVPLKIQLGPTVTEGRGTGRIPEKGRQAALESLPQITEVLSSNTKMVFITAGMGGGTGTGAAPVIAQEAKRLDILTVAIVTLPFVWEGRGRILRAYEGIRELRKYVDAMLVINNEKIMKGEPRNHVQAFTDVDEVLAIAAKGIAEIITIPGKINVDFEDVRTVMQNSGIAIMGSGTASGQDRAQKVLEQAIHSPLLDDVNIFGAKNILLNIINGQDLIRTDELSFIMDYLQTNAGLNAEIIFGITYDNNLNDDIGITVIATGFSDEVIPDLYAQRVQEVYRIDIFDQNTTKNAETKLQESTSPKTTHPTFEPQSNVLLKDPEKNQSSQITAGLLPEKEHVEIAAMEKVKVAPENYEPMPKSSNELLKDSDPAYPVDSKTIEEYEKIPAIERRKGKIDPNFKAPSEDKEISRFRISLDDTDEMIFREVSPYLNKNVD